MNRARILIVDDHPLVRLGLEEVVSQEPDMEVCSVARSAAEALERVAADEPDLLIVDLSLPDRSGLDLVKQISSTAKHPKVLVNSMHSEKLFADRALKAGASGYISKETDPDELLRAIRRVLGGDIYLSEPMTQHFLQVAAGSSPEEAQTGIDALSDREVEVLSLLGKALTTRQIAERLNLSVKTIETHRENIKAKLGLENNNELIRRAVEWWLSES